MAAGAARAAGFPFEQAAWLTFALIHYVLGQTMGEQARAELVALGGLHPAPTAAASHEEDENEAYRRLRALAQSADPDQQFAYALGVFLDGIKQRLP